MGMALGIIFAAAFLRSLQAPSTVPVTPAKPDASKVLSKIDGVPITAGDIEPYLWDWKANEILQTLINFRLVDNEAKKRNIVVSDGEVLKQMDEQIKRFSASLPPGQNVDDALMEQGYPRTRLYMTLRSSLLVDKIVTADFNPANYAKISTIVVTPKSSNLADLAPAIQRSQNFYNRLKKGEAWTKILSESTTDVNVLGNNGLLGWRSLTAFPRAVQDEIKTLKAGQYTQPAQTTFGIQIFRLEALGTSAKPAELDELKAQFLTQGRQQLVNKLRASAKIEKG